MRKRLTGTCPTLLATLFVFSCTVAAEDPSGAGGSAGAPSAGMTSSGQAGSQAAAGASLGGTGGAAAGASGSAGSSTGGSAAGSAGAAGGGGGGGGSAGAAGTGGGAGGGAGAAAGPMLPPITKYTDAGPFTTKMDTGVGPGGQYTVYRPEPLGQNAFIHAPIIFGPGIGQNVTVHNVMLTNFASHGFIVVGTPVLNGGPGAAANLKSLQDGLDWIVQQNSMAGIYQGKVWIDRAVSMGFSVGGTSAVQLGGDPHVFTVVSIHGHNATAALHGPMLQTTGTLDTVGMPLQQQTYDASKVQTFLATLVGANHPYIERNGGGDERPAIVAWLRYWIYNDAGAKNYFYGDDCVLCKTPWQMPKRKNWQ